MMIGGRDAVVKHLDPIFKTIGSRDGRYSAHAGTREGRRHGGAGLSALRANGGGHFVKMVHNGIEYGMMAAYAEGLGVLQAANIGKQTARDRRRDDAAARS